MPALNFAHMGVVHRLVIFVVVVLEGNVARAAQRFDIRAQPLSAALASFAHDTGITALVDAEIADGKTSTEVIGRLLPEDALRIMLSSTGLSYRRIGASAFAIGPNTTEPAANGRPEHHRREQWEPYFARVQAAMDHILCQREISRVDAFRVVVQLWIGIGGAVEAVHSISTSDGGDGVVDAIRRSRLVPPPTDLPQPITVVLRGKDSAAACRDSAAGRR